MHRSSDMYRIGRVSRMSTHGQKATGDGQRRPSIARGLARVVFALANFQLLLALTGCQSEDIHVSVASVGEAPVIVEGGSTVEYEISSGEDPILDRFSTVTSLATVGDSLLFVPELLSLQVNVFDLDSGAFKYAFGPARGVGPGEALGISDIVHDRARDELAVIDNRGQKILWFSLSGDLEKEQKLGSFFAGGMSASHGGELYFTQYQPNIDAFSEGGALHTLRLEAPTEKARSLFTRAIGALDTRDLVRWHLSRPGFFAIDANSGITAYATHDYEGGIWLRESQGEEYLVSGLAPPRTPAVIVKTATEIGAVNTPEDYTKFNVASGGLFYIFQNTTRGIVPQGDDKFLHFLTYRCEDKMCLAVQLLDAARRRVDAAMVIDRLWLSSYGTAGPVFIPRGTDSHGRVLVVAHDADGAPVVRSLRLKWPS